MIDILIVNNNVKNSLELMNFLHYKRLDIRIYAIISNLQELDTILRENRKISIILTNEKNSIQKNHKGVDIILINKYRNMTDILEKVEILIEKNNMIDSTKAKIINEIRYLGYNISHEGTKYLIDTIEYIMNNKEVNNLTKQVYPIIASKYKKTVHNVNCSISRETREMYLSNKIDKLKEYFIYDEDIKPNVKTVIYTVLSRINQI